MFSAWKESDKKVIQDRLTYLDDERQRIVYLRDKGPDKSIPWPKEPIHPKTLEMEPKMPKKALSSEELHEYLKSKCISHLSSIGTGPAVPVLAGNNRLEDYKVVLEKHYERVKHGNSKNLRYSVELGLCLIAAKKQHKAERNGVPWCEWLQKNVCICKSYGNKLEKIAMLLQGYPKLRRLGISFTELYKMRADIESMLTTLWYRRFWEDAHL